MSFILTLIVFAGGVVVGYYAGCNGWVAVGGVIVAVGAASWELVNKLI